MGSTRLTSHVIARWLVAVIGGWCRKRFEPYIDTDKSTANGTLGAVARSYDLDGLPSTGAGSCRILPEAASLVRSEGWRSFRMGSREKPC